MSTETSELYWLLTSLIHFFNMIKVIIEGKDINMEATFSNKSKLTLFLRSIAKQHGKKRKEIGFNWVNKKKKYAPPSDKLSISITHI